MRTPILVLGLIFTPPSLTFCQNLIQNPGFESGTIPTGQNQVHYATGWTKDCGRYWVTSGGGFTNQGSPDLFDKRSSNCEYDIPSNKWNNVLNERTDLNRYVGFSGGYATHTDGTVGPFYGETVKGTLTQAINSASCSYAISFWAAVQRGTKSNCGTLNNFVSVSQNNRIEVVLRKDNDCTNGLVVWTSPLITSWNWTQFVGQFTLTSVQASVGYNRIEFRMTPRTSTEGTGTIHGTHLDDVSLSTVQAPVGHSPDFTLTATNPSGSPTNYLVTATVSSIPTESSFYWEVCEVNINTNQPIAGTCMVNPSNWWNSSLLYSNTFPGYCCNSGTTSGNGTFQLGRKYKVVRGTWGPCHPYVSITKYVYMATSGMVLIEEERAINKSIGVDEVTFGIYPSPASTEIRINWSGPDVQSIRVLASNGKLMHEFGPADLNTPISVESFPSGIYIVTVTHTSGSSSKRFLVSH